MMKIIMKYNSIKEIVTGAPNDAQDQNNAHPKTSPIDCDVILDLIIMALKCMSHLYVTQNGMQYI